MEKKLLSDVLKALCLIRDYVGEDLLPPIDGWEWYDIGKQIEEIIPNDEWAKEFRLRVNKYRR